MSIKAFLYKRMRQTARPSHEGVAPAVARVARLLAPVSPARSCLEPLESRQLLSTTFLPIRDFPLILDLPEDNVAPTATLKIDDIKAAGGTSGKLTVVYEDNVALNLQTIDLKDVSILTPNGVSLAVTAVEPVDDKQTPQKHEVVYTFNAVGGSWDHTDSGSYRVVVVSGEVADSAGNLAPTASASLKVEIDAPVVPPPPPVVPPPPPVDTTAPTAVVSPISPVDQAGTSPKTVTVTYQDAGNIDPSSIGIGDLSVLGPGGSPLAVTGVSIQPNSNSAEITAVYTLLAPGSSWDVADNGAYSVIVNAGAVSDQVGNGVAAVAASLNVNVPIPVPVIDESFSGGGVVNAGFVAEGSAALPDGKLLVVGRQGDLASGSSQYVVKKLNADGSTDTSFGSGGVVTSAPGGNEAAFAIVVGPDGSIFITGSRGADLAVTKLKSSGSPDNKFGDKGQTVVDLGADNDRAYSVAIGPDGSVVAVGSSGATFALVKLTAKGEIDGAFGTGGIVTGGPEMPGVCSSVAVLGDGRIVCGGSSGDNVVVYRLLADGSWDGSLSEDGQLNVEGMKARTDLGGADNTIGIAVQGDKLLVTGRHAGDFAIARLNANGSLDTTFGDNGVKVIDLGGDDDADQVIVQPTGQIFIVGTSEQGANIRLGVVVLTAEGQLDANFGAGGIATVDSGFQGTGKALHIGTLVVRAFASAQSNGQVVVGAGQNNNTPQQAGSGLRRLNVPGSGLLGSFGNVGGVNKKLSFIDNDGTKVTIKFTNGSGKALFDGSVVDLEVSDSSDSSRLIIKTSGGDGQVNIRHVELAGGLSVFNARTAVVSGAITSPGHIQKAVLRSLDQGTFAAGGGIGTLKVMNDVKDALVLAGADLGDDNALGGAGADGDTFAAGSIGKLMVKGAIRGAVVTAGLTSDNATLLDAGDTIIDAPNSIIGVLIARQGLDAASKVAAGSVGTAKIPELVDTTTDLRFQF